MSKTKSKAKHQPNPRGTFYVEDIPPALRCEFKALCARKDVPMKSAIRSFMEQAVGRGTL